MLEIKPRDLYMLGQYFTTGSNPQPSVGIVEPIKDRLLSMMLFRIVWEELRELQIKAKAVLLSQMVLLMIKFQVRTLTNWILPRSYHFKKIVHCKRKFKSYRSYN